MDEIVSLAQGDPSQQRQVLELVPWDMKEIYLSLLGELKDFSSIKRSWLWIGSWTSSKDVPRWIGKVSDGTIRLSACYISNLEFLLSIPSSQRHIDRKTREILIRKLRLIHFSVTGTIGHWTNDSPTCIGTNPIVTLSQSETTQLSHLASS